ncbi:MAG: translocation/assembly module TamB domain-containing protein [Thermonemataceae bacterium]|nr:translocation/assembly module TamB domain-containing protein [Thermonemataceae bacterium]
MEDTKPLHTDFEENKQDNLATTFTTEQVEKAKGKRIFRKIQKIIWAFIRWALFKPLLLLGFIFLMLNVPMVQTFIAQKFANYLSEKLHFPISIQKVRLNLLNQDITLKGVQVIDRQGEEMLYLEELSSDFDLWNAVEGKNIFIDKITLKHGHIAAKFNAKANKLNLEEFISAIDSLTAPKQKKPRKPNERAAIFTIEEALLDEVTFSYNDPRQDSIKNGFDYAHFKLEGIDGYFKNVLFVADTVAFEAQNLQMTDKLSGLNIHNFNVKFLHDKHSLQFKNIYAEINNSVLQDSLVLSFDNVADLGHFEEKVRIDARLDSTLLHTKDLALFAPILAKYDDTWRISGNFNGTLQNFVFNDFTIGFGTKTNLKGSFSAEGLPKIEAMLAFLQLEQNSVLHTPDLEQYVPDKNTMTYLQKFGDVHIIGRFDGFSNDFKANAKLETALGNAQLDTYFIQKEGNLPTYEGTLALQNFQAGKLIDNESIKAISMKGDLKGKGFTIKDLDLDFKGNVEKIGVLAYEYNQIEIDGKFKNKFFDGKINSHDISANLNADAHIDFSKKVPEITLNSDILWIDFNKLGFLKDNITFKGFIHTQSKGFDFQNFQGNLLLRNATLGFQEKNLNIDSLWFNSEKNEYGYHFLDFYSPYVSSSVIGKFTLQQLGETSAMFFEELFLGIKNQKSIQNDYYQQKRKKKIPTIDLEYTLDIHNIQPILDLLDSSTHISPNLAFKGIFKAGQSSHFTLKSLKVIPEIKSGDYYFKRNSFQFEAYKNELSDNITAELNIFSNEQAFGGFQSEQLSLNAIWLDGIIDFRTKIQQKESSNKADIQGHITLDNNKTIIEFDESNISLLETLWRFEPSRKITIFTQENGKILFDNFMLSNEQQELICNGMIAENMTDEALRIDINHFNLATLNVLLGKNFKLKGNLDAHIALEDVYEQIKVNANFNTDSLKVNDFLIGNIQGHSVWDNEKQLADLSMSIYQLKDYIFFLEGTYEPKADNLDLIAKLRKAPINILEPFANSLVSKLDGFVSGDLNIKGKLAEPELTGLLRFEAAKFMVNYLETTYETSSSIVITKNEFLFNKFRVLDEERNLALLNGSIFHEYFKYFVMNLTFDFEKFTLLNIKEKEKVLYYGKGVASGQMSIKGEPDDLQMSINAKTEKGTKIFLPLDGYSEVGDANYYQFTDFEKDMPQDSTQKLNVAIQSMKIMGLEMDIRLDVTEDAYFEIQLDRQTGDIMKGYGKGLIQMDIDKRGNFGIWGDYSIENGSYNFTMKNLISKKFNIRKGSKIYFEGDVFQAYMDVKATYDANASFTAFLPTSEINPETSRKFPVSVVAHLVGDLLAPKVSFDIDFKDIEKKITNPSLQAAMFKVKSDIQSNELELNRQVGSLVIFGNFTSNAEGGSMGSASGRTLGEFLSNQLSSFASKLDENIEINLDASEIGANNSLVGLRMSYSLMDGRLKVISDNRLDSRNQSSNFTNEWIVEYALTEDGQYKLKMYGRSSFGNNTTITNNTNATGVSLTSSYNFNSLKDIFKKKKKKQKEEMKLPSYFLKKENEKENQPNNTKELPQ